MPGSRRTPGRWPRIWMRFCAVRLRGRAFGQLRGFRARGLSAVVGQLPRACLRRFAYLGDLRVHPRRGEAREAGCTFPAPGERAQLLPRGAQNGAVIAQRAERALYVEATRPALAGRGHRHRRAVAPRRMLWFRRHVLRRGERRVGLHGARQGARPHGYGGRIHYGCRLFVPDAHAGVIDHDKLPIRTIHAVEILNSKL